MATNFTAGQFYAADKNGKPLKGGMVYTYARGTTTNQATYTDYTRATENDNPVVLDEFGRASIWLGDQPYTIRVVNADGVEQYTELLDYTEPTSDVVSPLSYGASLSSSVDSKAAIIAACATGKIVDGGGRTYGVSGRMDLTTLRTLRNINLVQLNPSASNCRTIRVTGPTQYTLEDISIDMGGAFTVGSSASINENAGIYCTGGRATLRNVEVYNGGPSTAIFMNGCTKVVIDNARVHDMRYELAAVTDDCIQGIYLNNCQEADVSNSNIYAFSGSIAGVASKRFHRGFLAGSGASRFTFTNCHANDIDQGFDFTGGGGSTYWTVSECTATDCGTWGFKAANTAYCGVYVGCHALRCGQAGFVASGPSSAADAGVLYTQRIRYIACTSTNPGSSGLWSNAKGFYVAYNPAVDPTYPRDIQFFGCDAIDDQGSPTMDYGFLSDVPLTASAVLANTLNECSSVGHTVADFSGFYSPRIEVQNTNTQATTDGATLNVLFDTDTYDPLNGHSTSSLTNRVNVPYTGVWLVEVSVEWAANNNGRRLVTVQKNGAAPIAGGSQSIGGGNNSGVAAVSITKTVRLVAGDYLNVTAVQNSGGALNVTAAYLTLTLIRAST